MINYLAPGLYEMVIEQDPSKPWMNDYKVKFEERTIADLMALDDGFADEDAFVHVAKLSEIIDGFYNAFLSPVISSLVTKEMSLAVRLLHPLRVQRYVASDVNPFFLPVKTLAPYVKENRLAAKEENRFRLIEKDLSDLIEEAWNLYRDVRDFGQESLFKAIYSNPWITRFSAQADASGKKTAEGRTQASNLRKDKKKWVMSMEEGGYVDGVIRILAAVISIDKTIEEIEIKEAGQIVRNKPEFREMDPDDFRSLVSGQFRMIQVDRDKALEALPKLLKTKKERTEAIKFAKQVATAGGKNAGKAETDLIERIETILKKG